MSPAAPEATNRASTTPRRDGVARLAGRGGGVDTATGRTPRRSMQTRRRLPDGGPTRQATVHSPAGTAGPDAHGTVRAPAPSQPADTDIGRMACGFGGRRLGWQWWRWWSRPGARRTGAATA